MASYNYQIRLLAKLNSVELEQSTTRDRMVIRRDWCNHFPNTTAELFDKRVKELIDREWVHYRAAKPEDWKAAGFNRKPVYPWLYGVTESGVRHLVAAGVLM